jgi:hypothetical protein
LIYFANFISIRKILEGGVVDKFLYTRQKNRPTNRWSKTGRTQQVGMAFVFPIIAILITGFLASIVAFVFENLIFCKQLKKRENKVRTQRMPYLIIVKEKKNPST